MQPKGVIQKETLSRGTDNTVIQVGKTKIQMGEDGKPMRVTRLETEIEELLKNPTKEDDPDAILEDPVSVPKYIQKPAKDIAKKRPELVTTEYYNQVKPNVLHERIDDRWYDRLRRAGVAAGETKEGKIEFRARRGLSSIFVSG